MNYHYNIMILGRNFFATQPNKATISEMDHTTSEINLL